MQPDTNNDQYQVMKLAVCVLAGASCSNTFPNVVVERKNNCVSLHYRLNPRLENDLSALAHQLCSRGGFGHRIFQADFRIEVKKPDSHKGNAIRQLMNLPQYAQRRPIFVGDSEFDIPGLKEVQKLGGIAMSVQGSFSNSTGEVRNWLKRYAAEATIHH